MRRAVEALRAVVAAVPDQWRGDAASFHEWIERELKARGFRVRREVRVGPEYELHEFRRGYFDLVLEGDQPVAVELDDVRPRQKSITKLLTFHGARVIVLRNARPYPTPRASELIEQARSRGIVVLAP